MVYAVVFFYGLLLGSFVNALVWRLHGQLDKHGNPKKKVSKKLSVLKGRSMCPNCKHELAATDLVPLFSWLALRGRCRYCKKSISWQYPLVEFATGILFALSLRFWPYDASGASWLVFSLWLVLLTGLIALAIYDFRWMLLPNRILNPLIIVATVITALSWAYLDSGTSLLGIAASIAIAGGIFYLLFMFSDGRWIGGGDVKYGLLAGVLLANPVYAFMNLMFASLLGTAVIFVGLLFKKVTPKSQIPFGPFLIVATFIVYLVGDRIVDWYETSVLLVGAL